MNVLNNCFYSSFAFPMNQGSKSWSDLHLCKIIFICFNNRENYVIYCLGTLLWLIDFTRKVKVKSLSHVRLYVTSWSVRLPCSSVHGIFQARVLDWVAISFSRGSSQPRDWTQVSHIVGRQFTIWATREVHNILVNGYIYPWVWQCIHGWKSLSA